MDLGVHRDTLARQLARHGLRFLSDACDTAFRRGNAIAREKLLGLIFMKIHWRSSRSALFGSRASVGIPYTTSRPTSRRKLAMASPKCTTRKRRCHTFI